MLANLLGAALSFESSITRPRIVIVGGGAGGLELAVRLGKFLGKRNLADIVLVDAAKTHLWKPLLHQVAAGTLDSHADEVEYLALGRKHGFSFRLGRMEGLNRNAHEITLSPTLDDEGAEVLPGQTLHYTYLVLALGSQSNDFGTRGARENSIMLDSVSAAERFHQRLINTCLRAQTATQQSESARFTVTIIGGGATGVELSGELHTTAKIMASYGLEQFDPRRDMKIVIIDAAPRLLPALPQRLSEAVACELTALGIEIHIDEKVVEISKAGVSLASGKFVPSEIVVWAAGIKAPEFLNEIDGLETNRINQLVVRRTLQTTRDEAVFAIGDCCACLQEDGKTIVPPRAQSAHQQASLLAKSFRRKLKGKSELEFSYHDYGSLVSLGHYGTVGNLMGAIASGSVFVEGKIAKLMYWSLHKQHQIAINGVFHTFLASLAEAINLVRNPRIKLH